MSSFCLESWIFPSTHPLPWAELLKSCFLSIKRGWKNSCPQRIHSRNAEGCALGHRENHDTWAFSFPDGRSGADPDPLGGEQPWVTPLISGCWGVLAGGNSYRVCKEVTCYLVQNVCRYAIISSSELYFILFFMKLVVPSGPNSVQLPVFQRGTVKRNRRRENMAQLFPQIPNWGIFRCFFFFFQFMNWGCLSL